MDEEKEEKSEKEGEEKVTIRHTINAEEAFTLAKDIYDIRSVVKNIYNNRALIGRRLNLLSLTVSFVFTVLYVAYFLFTGLINKLSLGGEVALYCLFGIYAALFAVIIIVSLCEVKAKAKNIRRFSLVLKYFRLAIKIVSIAITIVALALATGDEIYAAKYVAIDIILIIFSIICLIVQLIPLLCGGFGALARWLLSPVKIKVRFSQVALEWYELTVTDAGENNAVKKVSKKYHDDIGVCLDNYLIPALGKKNISTIKSAQVLNIAENSGEDRNLVEGILKNIFEYATECGYVTFDPCRDLNLQGTIEEEKKEQKTVKSRFLGLGKRIGMSFLNKYIDKSTSKSENGNN